jgi:hypothetical protein
MYTILCCIRCSMCIICAYLSMLHPLQYVHNGTETKRAFLTRDLSQPHRTTQHAGLCGVGCLGICLTSPPLRRTPESPTGTRLSSIYKHSYRVTVLTSTVLKSYRVLTEHRKGRQAHRQAHGGKLDDERKQTVTWTEPRRPFTLRRGDKFISSSR